MTKNDNIGIILLAAGASSRFKKNKLDWVIDRSSLLKKTLVAAIDSIAKEILIVTGAYSQTEEKITSEVKATFVFNQNWEKGIGSSIKCGLRNILNRNPLMDAVIISVCDQPFISSDIFNGLINKYLRTNKKIIASEYTHSLGVPVLYDRSLFEDILNIPDNQGAKKYIIERAEKDIIATFPFPKGEIDIDTIEDLKKLTLT